MKKIIDEFVTEVAIRNPNEPEFIQAVKEVADNIIPYIVENIKIFDGKNVLLRMCEPERTIIFRVPWVDDKGIVQVNRGYRVQMNSAIGPYKGGLRFHPSVNLSILKFLAFEQTFKNALTTLPMGGAKGGSDFDPKGKSEGEVMRFCHSFMQELYRNIGPDTDVPAGDIGVGNREIGYMFGMYKKLKQEFSGVFTGKGRSWGGSHLRSQATGFGAIYFLESMLGRINEQIKGKTIAVSGFGNVAWGVVTKAAELGAKVVTLSGPDGYIYDEEGISGEKIDYMLELRASNNDVIKPYAEKYGVPFFEGETPWSQKVDIAMPCATQNELNIESAKHLVKNGVKCVVEGANMPTTPEAIEWLQKHKVLFSPGKASNAGGVSTSGLEMSQNSLRVRWSEEEVDSMLKKIMKEIHDQCVKFGTREDGYVDYAKGANIAGFAKLAEAMLEQGVV